MLVLILTLILEPSLHCDCLSSKGCVSKFDNLRGRIAVLGSYSISHFLVIGCRSSWYGMWIFRLYTGFFSRVVKLSRTFDSYPKIWSSFHIINLSWKRFTFFLQHGYSMGNFPKHFFVSKMIFSPLVSFNSVID